MKKYLIFLIFPIISFSNNNLIIKAVKENDLTTLKTFENNNNFNIKDDIMGKNLLGLSIFYNSSDVSKYLIKNYKSMINEVAKDGMLPIEDAILKENEEVLVDLLKNGAKIRKKDIYEQATKFGKGRMVKILRDFELKGK